MLAGSMVNVSTTAIAHPFGIASPNFAAGEMFPSLSWAAIAVTVGAVVAVLAILGFSRIAHFAKVCSPWMPLVFIAGAITCLPLLGVHHISDFMQVAREKIWIGTPVEGQLKYGFWSCVGFAWLCNISQHMGMGDVTIFRYAKKWYYGFASAFGMFIGHYVAWIASGIMCAAFIYTQKTNGRGKPQRQPG